MGGGWHRGFTSVSRYAFLVDMDVNYRILLGWMVLQQVRTYRLKPSLPGVAPTRPVLAFLLTGTNCIDVTC